MCPSLDNPGIVTVTRGYSDRGGRSVCPSWDNPGIVTVTRESADALTGGRSVCPSRDDPGITTTCTIGIVRHCIHAGPCLHLEMIPG